MSERVKDLILSQEIVSVYKPSRIEVLEATIAKMKSRDCDNEI